MVKRVGILGVFLIGLFFISFAVAAGTSFSDAELISEGEYTGGFLPLSSNEKPGGHYYKLELKSGYKYQFTKSTVEERMSVVHMSLYDEDREFLSTSVGDSWVGISDLKTIYWTSSSEDAGEVLYITVWSNQQGGVEEGYNLDVKSEDRTDLDSNVDVSDKFEEAYGVKEGSYPACCSLASREQGTDKEDMYKISVGKNEKLTVRLTPDSDATLSVAIYNEDRELENSKTGANSGAIVTAEYVSLESQEVYYEIFRDYNAGGEYGFEVSIEKASSEEKDAAEGSSSGSSSGSSGPDYSDSYEDYRFIFDDDSSSGSFFGGGFMTFFLIFFLGFYIYLSLTLMFIAKKTGTANGWFAWVPILNLVLMANIAKMSAWLLFLLLVPIANFIIIGMLWWKIAERRGFSGGLGLLMFVPIANLIMLGIFAWKGSGAGGSAPVRSESKVMGTQPTKTVSKSVDSSGSSRGVKSSSAGNFMSSLGAGMSPKKKKLFLILLGALVVMAISVLLPWASVSMGFVGLTISGWSIAWAIKVLFFLILGVGALVYLKKEQGAKAAIGLSGLCLLYMIFRLIVPPSIGSGFASIRISISTIFEFLGFGFYLFVIATVAVGVVAWLFMKAE